MGKLNSKTVFITGASSGIGEATARAFAAEGARLLIAARRKDRLDALLPELMQAGAAAVSSIQLDVRDREEVESAIAGLPAEWQAIDILVNNAGLSRGLDKLQEGDPEDWDEMIDTNVKGLLYVTRAIVPGMIARGAGHVVNLGSTAGEDHLSERGRLLRLKGRGTRHQRWFEARRAGHADPGDQRRSRNGRDRIQRSALSWRCRAGGQGI